LLLKIVEAVLAIARLNIKQWYYSCRGLACLSLWFVITSFSDSIGKSM